MHDQSRDPCVISKVISVWSSIFSVRAQSRDQCIIATSDVKRKKPFPDIYLEGARQIGMDPADCLVVEDAISGVQAAHAAGMHAAAVPTTFTLEELRERCAPEYELSHIRLLADLQQLQER